MMTWKTLIDKSTSNNSTKELLSEGEYVVYDDSPFSKLLDEVYEELVKDYILEDIKYTEKVCRRLYLNERYRQQYDCR